jgi:hypothetical protein
VSSISPTRWRRYLTGAASLTVPVSLAFIPVVGMLGALSQDPPPVVSLARISVFLISVVVAVYLLVRRRSATVASNVVGLPLLLFGLYPPAYFVATKFAFTDPGISYMYLAIALLSAWIAARLPANATALLQDILRCTAVVVAVFAGVMVYRLYVRPAPYSASVRKAVERLSSPLAVPRQAAWKPDVYHVVLDGLGRPDVLESEYGFSVRDQLRMLRELGFAIAPNGHANYVQTQLSLASMLNVDYLDELALAQGTNRHRQPLHRLISTARVPAVFKDLGYDVEFIGSGYLSSGAFERADRCDCPQIWFADAEIAALTLSPFRAVVGAIGSRAHFRRSLAVFDALERPRSGAAPRYVFAHVPMPHPPFVADDHGEFTNPGSRLGGTADGSFFAGSPDQYKSGYQAQTRFALARAVRAITRILQQGASEGRDVTVILHGDHGPRLGFDMRNPTVESGQRVLPVLLAVRWPMGRAPGTQPESLVNVYRALLQHIFHLDLPSLPNRSFVSGFVAPYVMVPVSATKVGAAETR